MNNFTITPSISQTSSTWIYQGSTSSNSEKMPQLKAESTLTTIPMGETTTQGPTVLKPSSFPEDYDERAAAFFDFIDLLEAEAEDTSLA